MGSLSHLQLLISPVHSRIEITQLTIESPAKWSFVIFREKSRPGFLNDCSDASHAETQGTRRRSHSLSRSREYPSPSATICPNPCCLPQLYFVSVREKVSFRQRFQVPNDTVGHAPSNSCTMKSSKGNGLDVRVRIREHRHWSSSKQRTEHIPTRGLPAPLLKQQSPASLQFTGVLSSPPTAPAKAPEDLSLVVISGLAVTKWQVAIRYAAPSGFAPFAWRRIELERQGLRADRG